MWLAFRELSGSAKGWGLWGGCVHTAELDAPSPAML